MPLGSSTVVIDGLVFPESPRWHDGRLWCSDMHGRRVVSTDLSGAVDTVFEVDLPSGLGFLDDGSMLAVAMHSRTIWRVEDGESTVHADLSGFPGEFLNDMVVDADGRAYVGCRTHRQPGQPPTSDLLLVVEPDGAASVAAADVIGPNGAVITPDGSTLILAETQANRITAFDRDGDGRLSGRRIFAQLDRSASATGRKVFPDGICLDAEGALWVGTAFGGEVLRVVEGGEVVDRWAPGNDRWAVAPTLGGPDRRTLYVATVDTGIEALRPLSQSTITDNAEHRSWARSLASGFVEAIGVEVPGAGLP